MNKPKISLIACAIIGALSLTGCNSDSRNNSGGSEVNPIPDMPYYTDWPTIRSDIAQDDEIEAKVARILAQMTLEEKVGQMIQPNLSEVTPEEVAEYKLGSLLNGGSTWPNSDKHASPQDWVDTYQAYWEANEAAWQERGGISIPFIWATDAVHGHNNVYRATVFPHNIGLGAARNPDLIEEIGKATAREIVATGLDWTFAPTVATPRDYRWGRVYEGYSEDPSIVYAYAGRMVQGLQGNADELKTDQRVISNVKHWLGDGGTWEGVDRGENHYSEEYLLNIHAAGYISGLEAGAQVVMTSFNSWHDDANHDYEHSEDYNYKLHGSRYIVNDVLKDKMGFDGFVVTDWNGHQEINGCTASNCPAVVNAGNDVLMVTSRSDWQAMYNNIIAQVKDGTIPQERIDDAVTRILRVKMRAGLWEKAAPAERTFAGDESQLGNDEHRALARQAVRESLVLLKNADNVLPLAKNSKILIAGSAMDDITKQTGGWSITWQGDGNTIEDFPGASTMLMAVEDTVGTDNVITDLSDADENTIAIVVIGEDPYAETNGDIRRTQTLEFASLKSSYRNDLNTIKELKEAGLTVVTVFYSGRPLYTNEEINHSDAFVAAWLPGSEAGGITDVIFDNGHDFKGQLSFSWPLKKCSAAINAVPGNLATGWVTPDNEQSITGEHAPLFPFGFGLNYGRALPGDFPYDLNNLPLDPRDYGCGVDAPDDGIAQSELILFGHQFDPEFVARITSGGWWTYWNTDVLSAGVTEVPGLRVERINKDHQYDALNIQFTGDDSARLLVQTEDAEVTDKNAYLNADSTLQFDVRTHTSVGESLSVLMTCEYPCSAEINIAKAMPQPSDNYSTVKIPLQCFADQGMSFPALDTGFMLYADAGEQMELDLGSVRYVPRSVDAAEDALECDAAIAD